MDEWSEQLNGACVRVCVHLCGVCPRVCVCVSSHVCAICVCVCEACVYCIASIACHTEPLSPIPLERSNVTDNL